MIHTKLQADSNSVQELPQTKNFAIIVSGEITQVRREAAMRAEKPRIDVIELERQHGAQIYDFVWLKERARHEFLTRRLIALVGFTHALVLRAFPVLRRMSAIYATNEDVGLALAALSRMFFLGRQPFLLLRLEQMLFGSTRLKRWIYSKYFRFTMRRVNLTVCRADSHSHLLQRALKLAPERFITVPEPVDTAFFNRANAPIEGIVTIPSGAYIVSAGLEMRDYATLIEAVRGLPVQLIIGAGSPWSKFTFDKQLEPPENVVVSTFDPMQMRELYRNANLVVVAVHPSRRTCGISVILEAWSMERAVVATRTIGLSHYVRDGQNGLFVNPRDPQDMRAKIQLLLTNTSEAKRLGLNGRQQVERENAIEKIVVQLNELVQYQLQPDPAEARVF